MIGFNSDYPDLVYVPPEHHYSLDLSNKCHVVPSADAVFYPR